jgi:hypothetical protein
VGVLVGRGVLVGVLVGVKVAVGVGVFEGVAVQMMSRHTGQESLLPNGSRVC